jgi:hypothetical protein
VNLTQALKVIGLVMDEAGQLGRGLVLEIALGKPTGVGGQESRAFIRREEKTHLPSCVTRQTQPVKRAVAENVTRSWTCAGGEIFGNKFGEDHMAEGGAGIFEEG